jgi:hypothetical protein
MTHVPPDTDRVREARVVVVAPVDDHLSEPTPVVGVGIDTDTGDGDDVRGRSMDTACVCGIVMVSIGLVWLATRAVSYGWASVMLTFVGTVCFMGVDMGVGDVDRSRTVQWIVLAVATCIVKHVGSTFWRDGVAVIVSNVLRLVGVGAMHRRHARGVASKSVFLLYGDGSFKILLHTYGYLKVGGVLYILAIVAVLYYLNTRVLVADVAWSPADVCFLVALRSRTSYTTTHHFHLAWTEFHGSGCAHDCHAAFLISRDGPLL